MKKINLRAFFSLSILSLFLNAAFVNAQMGGQSGKGMSGGSSTMGTNKPSTFQLEPLKSRAPMTTVEKTSEKIILPSHTPQASMLGQASYFFPGAIFNQNGLWRGGDNLLNLSSSIGIYFTITQPENDTLVIDENALKMACEAIFARVNINPKTMIQPNQAPLPFFQFQILIYPINNDIYAASCEGHLFESVTLTRLELDKDIMAYQAITWQKSNLIVTPTNKVQDQIKLNVENIAESFVEAYKAFAKTNGSLAN